MLLCVPAHSITHDNACIWHVTLAKPPVTFAGLVIHNHKVSVPVDYSGKAGKQVSVLAMRCVHRLLAANQAMLCSIIFADPREAEHFCEGLPGRGSAGCPWPTVPPLPPRCACVRTCVCIQSELGPLMETNLSFISF
jgi:hypothetical protein